MSRAGEAIGVFLRVVGVILLLALAVYIGIQIWIGMTQWAVKQ